MTVVLWTVLCMGGAPQPMAFDPVPPAAISPCPALETPPIYRHGRSRRAELYGILMQHSLMAGPYDYREHYDFAWSEPCWKAWPILPPPVRPPPGEPIPSPQPTPPPKP